MFRRLKTSFRPSEKLKIIICHLGRGVKAFQLAFYRRYTDIHGVIRTTENAYLPWKLFRSGPYDTHPKRRFHLWNTTSQHAYEGGSEAGQHNNNIINSHALWFVRCLRLFLSVPYDPGSRKISD